MLFRQTFASSNRDRHLFWARLTTGFTEAVFLKVPWGKEDGVKGKEDGVKSKFFNRSIRAAALRNAEVFFSLRRDRTLSPDWRRELA